MDTHVHPPEDPLYDKSYECPVCYHHFSSKTIRLRKNQLVSVDSDLYAHYSAVNPLLYDIILCPKCGYASLTATFDKLTTSQKALIKSQICAHYQKRVWPEPTNTQQAIIKHQLALASAIAKHSKLGEQAYLCLHIAWLYRDLGNTYQEQLYLKKASDGFKKALESEAFPILSLDEPTTMYIIADISFRLGDFETSRIYLSLLITKEISPQLRNRANDLKEKLATKA